MNPNEALQETPEAEDAENQQAKVIEKAEPTEAESRARRMGWKPKDEYVAAGKDEATFVDADTYVAKIEADMPELRARNKKLVKSVDKLEKGMEESTKLIRDLVENHKVQTEKAVKKAISDLKTQRAEAATNGDTARVEAISEEIEGQQETLKEVTAAPKPQAGGQDKPDIPQDVIEWAEANPWFQTDRVLNAVATARYGELMDDKSLTDKQRLAKVKAEVIRRFPEKFGNPKRMEAPAVEEGGAPIARNRNGAKTWNDLPRDAQDIGDRLIRAGAVKSKEAYLKSYQW